MKKILTVLFLFSNIIVCTEKPRRLLLSTLFVASKEFYLNQSNFVEILTDEEKVKKDCVGVCSDGNVYVFKKTERRRRSSSAPTVISFKVKAEKITKGFFLKEEQEELLQKEEPLQSPRPLISPRVPFLCKVIPQKEVEQPKKEELKESVFLEESKDSLPSRPCKLVWIRRGGTEWLVREDSLRRQELQDLADKKEKERIESFEKIAGRPYKKALEEI